MIFFIKEDVLNKGGYRHLVRKGQCQRPQKQLPKQLPNDIVKLLLVTFGNQHWSWAKLISVATEKTRKEYLTVECNRVDSDVSWSYSATQKENVYSNLQNIVLINMIPNRQGKKKKKKRL